MPVFTRHFSLWNMAVAVLLIFKFISLLDLKFVSVCLVGVLCLVATVMQLYQVWTFCFFLCSEYYHASVQCILLAGWVPTGYFKPRLLRIHGAVSVRWCKHCMFVCLHICTSDYPKSQWCAIFFTLHVHQDDSREVLEGWREELQARGVAVVISGHSFPQPRGGQWTELFTSNHLTVAAVLSNYNFFTQFLSHVSALPFFVLKTTCYELDTWEATNVSN